MYETISIREAAKRLGMTEDGIRKRIRRGELKGIKVDKRWMVVWDGEETALREPEEQEKTSIGHRPRSTRRSLVPQIPIGSER
jgi:excisionase family DNA binding protein